MKTQVWGSSPRAPMAAAMPCKSAEWLQEELESGGGRSLLLLDCRPHELFESSHIETAINLAIPGLMLRRLKKGNLPIRSIIPNHEDKERFVKRCKADTVLLYDEATADWQDGGAATSVLGLLLQKLRDDGCKAYYLKGEVPPPPPPHSSSPVLLPQPLSSVHPPQPPDGPCVAGRPSPGRPEVAGSLCFLPPPPSAWFIFMGFF